MEKANWREVWEVLKEAPHYAVVFKSEYVDGLVGKGPVKGYYVCFILDGKWGIVAVGVGAMPEIAAEVAVWNVPGAYELRDGEKEEK